MNEPFLIENGYINYYLENIKPSVTHVSLVERQAFNNYPKLMLLYFLHRYSFKYSKRMPSYLNIMVEISKV